GGAPRGVRRARPRFYCSARSKAMARRPQEVTIRRIIACLGPGCASPQAIARLALDMDAELLGLFIEDTELLRFAALPFAAEVGREGAAPRRVDVASVERALRSQAEALRRALGESLDPAAHAWTFRVTRATPASAV